MRTETIIETYLTFDELTKEQQEKAIDENFINGWHYEHCMEERIDTLKAFAKHIDGYLDYSLSPAPSRGEFITIIYEHNNLEQYLREFIEDKNDCPLTGVYYDEQLRESFDKNNLTKESLQEVLNGYINSIHDEYESMTTIEAISELCESNGYEFDADTLRMV